MGPALLDLDRQYEVAGLAQLLAVVVEEQGLCCHAPRPDSATADDPALVGVLRELVQALFELAVADDDPFLEVLVSFGDLAVMTIDLDRAHQQSADKGRGDRADDCAERYLHRPSIALLSASIEAAGGASLGMMSRLYDRIRAFGCEAFRPFHLVTHEARAELRAASREQFLAETEEKDMDEARRQELADYAGSVQAQVSHHPISTETFDATELDGIPVFAADEVAAYCAELPRPTDITELVTTVAPPFEHFFVEFQDVENPKEFRSWGWMIDQIHRYGEDEAGETGWQVFARLIIERDKNAPIGPVINQIFALDRQGQLITKEGEDELASGVWFPKMDPEDPPAEVVKDTGDEMVNYLLPALMAISFMHCKNVAVREVEPPEGQSKRWIKKRGEPLATYHVLEIGPMRAALEGEGESGSRGLKHALHVCRGHFKTFDEEAPLFGKTTGTFWWADQVRGRAEEGEVVKDYEVRVPGVEFGRPYEPADEEPELAQSERTGPDPDVAGRGLAAHNRTQNLLAQAVEAAGHDPRRPAEDEPNLDLAWENEGVINVAEVKSLTPATEEKQLRLAVGQVVRYRQQLARGGQEVRALIAVEYQPEDDSWIELCADEGIELCWPETFAEAAAG